MENINTTYVTVSGAGRAKAERDRIAGIEAMAMPGFEDLIQRAKEDPAQNAGTVAQAIILAQKQAGGVAMEQIRKCARETVEAWIKEGSRI